jgi:hypothetical protein
MHPGGMEYTGFSMAMLPNNSLVVGGMDSTRVAVLNLQTGGAAYANAIPCENTYNNYPEVESVFVDSRGGAFAATRGCDQSWMVSRSTDNGKTWSVVDKLANQHSSWGIPAEADLIQEDKDGNLYALGNVGDYIIRRSSDGGLTWSTVLDTPWAQSNLIVDSSNRLVYIGVNAGAPGQPDTTKILISDDHGNSWKTFTPPTGQNNPPSYYWLALKVDPSTGVYYILRDGEGFDLKYQPHALNDKPGLWSSSDQGSTWNLVSDLSTVNLPCRGNTDCGGVWPKQALEFDWNHSFTIGADGTMYLQLFEAFEGATVGVDVTTLISIDHGHSWINPDVFSSSVSGSYWNFSDRIVTDPKGKPYYLGLSGASWANSLIIRSK